MSLVAGCERPATPRELPAQPRLQTPAEPGVRPLPAQVWRGACFAHNWQDDGERGYGTDASADALDYLVDHNYDWISITPFGFMPDTEANFVRGEHTDDAPRGSEKVERLVAVTRQARERGLRVMLKPHIWIRGGKWRGAIQPKNDRGELDWDGWWDSHDEWILFYADLAQRLQLDALVIGLELHTAVQHAPERLVALAARVRRRYDGHITYSANWNEPVDEKVWVALDSVGVQFYPPLVDGSEASDARVRASLREHLDHWSGVARRADKPLVITEVGYRSAALALRHPNAWPEKHAADPDPALQTRAYRLFLDELRATPAIGGVFLWKIFTDSNTDEEGPDGFSPRGKPAESVIRRAFRKPEKEKPPG